LRPLSGIRVLDLSRLIPGPFATLVLRDLGAQVDKVEDPGAGDYLRYLPPQRGGASLAFHALNRGKRSAVVDLKAASGREALLRLCGHYDVLVEQFRPGVLARLGLGHEVLRASHPRLIVCALTGYGQSGPLAQRAGHDIDYLARGGLLALHGPPEAAPQLPGFQLADVSGAMWCVIAILAALRQRDRSGEGTVCDVAMTDGLLGFGALGVSAGLAGEAVARGAEVLTGGIAPYNTYLAKDGVPMALGALEPKFWLTFAGANGIDGDASALLPGPHQAALRAKVAAIFASRTSDEWRLFAESHDCCVEPATLPSALAADPHIQARGLLFEMGPERIPGWRTPVSDRDDVPPPAARSGEHTRAIFREAGFGDDEIDALVAGGALRESA
jgi:crotonobetainyl-CoA:carnitine CoA-transferase CaiB-like acyl-CoA transferase